MVVVVLIATLALVSMPRLEQLMNPDVGRDVQMELENVVMAVRQESILAQTPMAIIYSVEDGVYGSATFSEEGAIKTEGDPLSLRRRLPGGLRFMDISTSREDRTRHGICFTVVWPTGWIEPTTIHVQDDRGNPYTLLVEPLAGTVRLEEGYLVRRKVSS
jgi:hypothetical protein